MKAIAALSLTLLALAKEAAAACDCGFRDPATDSLWTDAIITYFNETGAAQSIVSNPERSADRYGQDDAGSSGNGQQPWVASQRTNDWEDDFGATWRSAVSFNNTYFSNDSSSTGLHMQVSPADTVNRISYGSQLVSRRRDILFGSFQAFVKPSTPVSAGTTFDMEVAYNQSELIRSAIFSADAWGDGTLQYSFSARNMDAAASYNFSKLDATFANISARTYDFRQYRMDWLPRSIVFSNDGTNATSNKFAAHKDANTNLPSVGGPWSFKHWSNGSPTESQGPPIYHEAVAKVLWARLFFNSSLASRGTEFESQCASSATKQICSTEDHTLREVTSFDLHATQHLEAPKWIWTVPLYAIIVNAAAGGMFVLLLIHALFKRYFKAQKQKHAFYARDVQQGVLDMPDPDASLRGSSDSLIRSRKLDNIDDAADIWDNPELILNDDDDFSDSDDDTVYSKYEFDDPLRQRALEKKGSLLDLDGEPIEHFPPTLRMSILRSKGSGASSLFDLSRRQSAFMAGERPDLLAPPSFRPMSWTSPVFTQDASQDQSNRSSSDLTASDRSVRRPRAGSHLTLCSEIGEAVDGLGRPPSLKHRRSTIHFDDGTSAPFTWSTRIAEWQPAPKTEHADEVGQLAEVPKVVVHQSVDASALPSDAGPFSRLLLRFRQMLFVGDTQAKITGSGATRVDYLDGLRGFACLLVALHHWLLINYYSIPTPGAPAHYSWESMVARVLGPVITNGGLNVGIFFTVSGSCSERRVEPLAKIHFS